MSRNLMIMKQLLPLTALALASHTVGVTGFDANKSNNLAVFWGQNAYGAAHPDDSANAQNNLSAYCQDDTIDVIPLAFASVDGSQPSSALPTLNLGNICSIDKNGHFDNNVSLPHCEFMAEDIKACQAKGKLVTLSLGGSAGYMELQDDGVASGFAQSIWYFFLGGINQTDIRPFGDAILDGVDLNIVNGSSQNWNVFVDNLRDHAKEDTSKKYYVTASPVCSTDNNPMDDVLGATTFDAVYVQFSNDYCSLDQSFNYGDWDKALNGSTKLYIGAPAASEVAVSGYVDANKLADIAKQTASQYSSLGGIMLYDASEAAANNNYASAVQSAVSGSSA